MNPQILVDTNNLAFGLTMAIGGLGPAIGIGMIGAKAVEAIGRNQEAASKFKPT
jgi:F-type H+-transporting ATPase subunit c